MVSNLLLLWFNRFGNEESIKNLFFRKRNYNNLSKKSFVQKDSITTSANVLFAFLPIVSDSINLPKWISLINWNLRNTIVNSLEQTLLFQERFKIFIRWIGIHTDFFQFLLNGVQRWFLCRFRKKASRFELFSFGITTFPLKSPPRNSLYECTR